MPGPGARERATARRQPDRACPAGRRSWPTANCAGRSCFAAVAGAAAWPAAPASPARRRSTDPTPPARACSARSLPATPSRRCRPLRPAAALRWRRAARRRLVVTTGRPMPDRRSTRGRRLGGRCVGGASITATPAPRRVAGGQVGAGIASRRRRRGRQTDSVIRSAHGRAAGPSVPRRSSGTRQRAKLPERGTASAAAATAPSAMRHGVASARCAAWPPAPPPALVSRGRS